MNVEKEIKDILNQDRIEKKLDRIEMVGDCYNRDFKKISIQTDDDFNIDYSFYIPAIVFQIYLGT